MYNNSFYHFDVLFSQSSPFKFNPRCKFFINFLSTNSASDVSVFDENSTRGILRVSFDLAWLNLARTDSSFRFCGSLTSRWYRPGT